MLNKKLTKIRDETIEPDDAFDYLKAMRIIDKNTESVRSLRTTSVDTLINAEIKKHNEKARNTLKGYTVWAAVVYLQKDTTPPREAKTQRAMTIQCNKNKTEFTREFIENAAREWMEKCWPSDIEFLRPDDENFTPPYTVNKIKDLDLHDLPLYNLKEYVTKGMRLYSKFPPLCDGLVKDPDEYVVKEFENKCGEFNIYYTLAKAAQ